MRDYLPDQLRPRLEVIERMRRIFELYGFQPLETPAMERLEVLSGKYGEEGDKLTFRVMKRGAELKRALKEVGKEGSGPDTLADLGLRFDLTVPLARVVARYGASLPRPFKRYQIGPAWRADRPQHGRYREFIQCDVDIVGTDSSLADAELIALTIDVLTDLELPPFEVRVNHRGLLTALSTACGNPPERFFDFCAALDKLDTTGREGVESEMRDRKLETAKLQELWELADMRTYIDNSSGLNQLVDYVSNFVEDAPGGKEFLGNLIQVLEFVDWLHTPSEMVMFDPALARGLDYYTGPVFEVVMRDRSMASIGGGGRYDELIGIFSGKPVPATGTSFGLERIVDLMVEHGSLVTKLKTATVQILAIEGGVDFVRFSGRILKFLHGKNISCELPYRIDSKLGKQIQTADKRGVQFVIIIGPDELREFGIKVLYEEFPIEAAKVTVKRLADGVQRQLTLDELVAWVKEPIPESPDSVG